MAKLNQNSLVLQYLYAVVVVNLVTRKVLTSIQRQNPTLDVLQDKVGGCVGPTVVARAGLVIRFGGGLPLGST